MGRPFILAVDDDPDVRRTIQRDLNDRYSESWQIFVADSCASAKAELERMKQGGDDLALVLCDERMPDSNAEELIESATALFPDAKKVMLAELDGSDEAIGAIDRVGLDHYLVKPWEPPEECLYPVLDDLLDDWKAAHMPDMHGLKVYGPRWDPKTHEIKDFLARNGMPYEWTDAEAEKDDPEVKARLEGCAFDELPLIQLPNGETMKSPSAQDLGHRLGLSTHAREPFYDLVIVGGGPAGLAAGVYGASEGLRTMIVEREAPGGQAGMSSRIENYLGFPSGLTGADLARRAVAQAKRFGVEFLVPQEAVRLRSDGSYKVLTLSDGQEVRCHTVILAMGVSYRRLNVPGEERLYGKGIYYGAALSEAVSCEDESVAMVGGANSAGQAALYFAKYAGKVTMIIRADSLEKDMSQYLVDQVRAVPNIEVLTDMVVAEACGEERLESLRLQNSTTGEVRWLDTNAMFVFIGAEPRTDWLEGVVCRDEKGYIRSGRYVSARYGCEWPLSRPPGILETNVPGVYVAGDVRSGSIKRVANSVGEGSIAVHMVHAFLAEVRA